MAGKKLKSQGEAVRAILSGIYTDPRCGLSFTNQFQLLVATVLSAQCTDVRVNMVTPLLFEQWPDPASMAEASEEQIAEVIKSLGFFRSKASYLKKLSRLLIQNHSGTVPMEIPALTSFPGVGRKTANVVINEFGMPQGIAVDTHVTRLSRRLGLTLEKDPLRIEDDLMKIFPLEHWRNISHLLISHGRAVCSARKPQCEKCPLSGLCPWFTSTGKGK